MGIAYIISYIFIGVGIVFMLLGVIGIVRFKNFYPRMLVTTKVDTVGALTLIFGVAIRHGFSFFTAKLLFIAVLMLILKPLVSHIVTRSAYVSGEMPESNEKTRNLDSIESPKTLENSKSAESPESPVIFENNENSDSSEYHINLKNNDYSECLENLENNDKE